MHPVFPLHQDGPGLRVDVREPGRIAAFGELDSAAAVRLEPAVRSCLRQQPGDLVVDLAGVTFLDSAGIRSLLACWSAADEAGRRLRLVNPNGVVRRVLEITGLLEMFGIRGPRPERPEAPSAAG